MNKLPIEEVFLAPLIDLAIREDIGTGDITTEHLLPKRQQGEASIIAKEGGVVAGLFLIEYIYQRLSSEIETTLFFQDGDQLKIGATVATVKGAIGDLLSGERMVLNFLQRLSGIATETARYAKALEGTKTRILDTRKTLPAHRLLDKYAVKAGGGVNHRMGLYDMVMIKDNHIVAAGSIAEAVRQIRPKLPKGIRIEVETTTLEEVREALEARAHIIMLDNMSVEQMAQAVALIGGKAQTEASGNISLERLKEVASAGVDYISVGALTHSTKALDLSMKFAYQRD